jgi:hypothetical protein
MSGTTTSFWEFWFVFVPAALLLLIVYYGLRTEAPKASLKFRGTVLLSLLLVLQIVLGWQFVAEVRQHEFLSQLDAKQIQVITVGSAKIENPAAVGRIIRALRASEWLHASSDEWMEPVPFQIRFKTGDTYEYQIGSDLRGRGIIVEFPRRGSHGSQLHYALSSPLAFALHDAGIELPR